MILPGNLNGEGQNTRILLGSLGELGLHVFKDGCGVVRLYDEWRCVRIRGISLNWNAQNHTRYFPGVSVETIVAEVNEGESCNTHHFPLDKIAFTDEELVALMKQYVKLVQDTL
jgi:hypothetical protein